MRHYFVMERPRRVLEAVYLEDHAGLWFCHVCLRRLANQAEQELHGPPDQGQLQSGPGVCSQCHCSSTVMRYDDSHRTACGDHQNPGKHLDSCPWAVSEDPMRSDRESGDGN